MAARILAATAIGAASMYGVSAYAGWSYTKGAADGKRDGANQLARRVTVALSKQDKDATTCAADIVETERRIVAGVVARPVLPDETTD